MALSTSDTFIGITTPLEQYEYDGRSGRRTPDVRVSYVDSDGHRQIVTICSYGARILAKGLLDMAKKAEGAKR